MVDRRLFFLFIAVTLFVSVLHAERARNDNLQNEEIDFESDNTNVEAGNVIETVKRFVLKKPPVVVKPNPHRIPNVLTTRANKILPGPTKSSISDNMFAKKSSTTHRSGSQPGGKSPDKKVEEKDGCHVYQRCKNGGLCRIISGGRVFCICPRYYYGEACENKYGHRTTRFDKTDQSRDNPCTGLPCRNQGECVGMGTTYYCRCKTPYYGINCDKHIGIAKREEIIDESNLSEEKLTADERDLQEDTEDLRGAITEEDDE